MKRWVVRIIIAAGVITLLAARFVKIHLVFQSFEDKTYIPVVNFPEDSFEKKGEKDYIFSGGPDWLVYPKDARWFHIELNPHMGGEIRSGNYHFQCMVRAEGLDAPVSRELRVKITDYHRPASETRES